MMALALGFTVFQLFWSTLWGSLHVRIRRNRQYARGKAPVGKLDVLYRSLNPLLFVAQLGLTVACLWSDSRWLLQFHDSPVLHSIGAALLTISLALTRFALRHLGDNYAPCYDSHLPRTITSTGPYARIRHPMYLAKMLAATGTLLLSGSLWFLPSTLYLVAVTWRALRSEDALLRAAMPGYAAYAARSRLLIPYLF
jgi:protein-S-isoprenylcysteine O-methyltransferase Ste14